MNNKFDTLVEFAIGYGKYLKPDSTDKDMISFLESIKSETGYSCPKCGTDCSHEFTKPPEEGSYIMQSETHFNPGDCDCDPHYEWKELHKCTKCEEFYVLHNGT